MGDTRPADLSRAELSGAALIDADLTNASLSRAELSGAELSGATLVGANLQFANLEGVRTDLGPPSLLFADLSGANLTKAHLTEAVDLVIVWWRRHDGDLSDSLLDALRLLTDGGAICLATPKPGSPEYVDAIDISDIAKELNLRQTGTFVIGPDWRATKLQT